MKIDFNKLDKTITLKDIDYSLKIVKEIDNFWSQGKLRDSSDLSKEELKHISKDETTGVIEFKKSFEELRIGFCEVDPKGRNKDKFKRVKVFLKNNNTVEYDFSVNQFKCYRVFRKLLMGI